MSVTALVHAVVAATVASIVLAAAPAASPLAGVVLEDGWGRAWRLEELSGSPVLLVIADRQASQQANDWGERLAARSDLLTPWRSAGRIAWLAVADLRRVPEYARDAARARVREREAARSEGERRQASPLLLDWEGRLGATFDAARGEASVVLLSPEHGPLLQVRGAPTAETVTRVVDALAAAIPHSDRGASMRSVPKK